MSSRVNNSLSIQKFVSHLLDLCIFNLYFQNIMSEFKTSGYQWYFVLLLIIRNNFNKLFLHICFYGKRLSRIHFRPSLLYIHLTRCQFIPDMLFATCIVTCIVKFPDKMIIVHSSCSSDSIIILFIISPFCRV